MKSENREIMLVEYQKSQDSAEHYDTTSWTLISVLLGFVFLVLKEWYELFSKQTPSEFDWLARIFLITFGMSAIYYLSLTISRSNKIKEIKYGVCREIEDMPGFEKKANRRVERELSNFQSGSRALKIGLLTLTLISIGVLVLDLNNPATDVPLFQSFTALVGFIFLLVGVKIFNEIANGL